MLQDIYVREKLNDMSREASRTQRVPASLGVPLAAPAARLLGQFLCRVGERLQSTGDSSGHGTHETCVRERGARLRRTI